MGLKVEGMVMAAVAVVVAVARDSGGTGGGGGGGGCGGGGAGLPQRRAMAAELRARPTRLGAGSSRADALVATRRYRGATTLSKRRDGRTPPGPAGKVNGKASNRREMVK